MLLRFYKKRAIYFLQGIVYSFLILFITTDLKVINPLNIGWLQIGDGITEISWEFFRQQPLFQFPLGLNPKYGLEISGTIATDGQIPLVSLLLHPLSPILPGRFQFYGIYLFLSLALNFYFASRIFEELGLKPNQIFLNSILLSTSPVILNRYIDIEHYSLTSAWIIFWAIVLCIKKKNKKSYFIWIVLFILAILIHLYFVLFITVIYLVINIKYILYKEKNLYQFLVEVLTIFAISISSMYLVGFFFGDISGVAEGYGLTRSTLSSLIDSSGWSQIFPDLPQTEWAYEGFSYLGTSTIILLFFSLLSVKFSFIRENKFKREFTVLWIAALLLYIFSLSNRIAFANIEVFEFSIPNQILDLLSIFRSTGRFAWLIVFVAYIWFSYIISLKIKNNIYTYLLIFTLIITLLDYSNQLTSQKKSKFLLKYDTNLTNIAWKSLSQCYDKIRIYPPVPEINNLYNFLNLANNQQLGINSARLGRFSKKSLEESFNTVHEQFKYGTLASDSVYIFTSSPHVNQDIINYHLNIAKRTLDSNSGWSVIDGFTVIAPKLKVCNEGAELKRQLTNYGSPKEFIYKGDPVFFGEGQNNQQYSLTGATLTKNGFAIEQNTANLIFNLEDKLSPKEVEIQASIPNQLNQNVELNVRINNSEKLTCTFNSLTNKCKLELTNINLNNQIAVIDFEISSTNNLEEASKIEINSLNFIE